MSGMNFVSNPLVNMHLGGRFDTYPKRRGLTRIKELTEAGINVAFGEDDIRDPWSRWAPAICLTWCIWGRMRRSSWGIRKFRSRIVM